MSKNTIRVVSTSYGTWCRLGDGKAGVLASNKAEGVEVLNKLYPGDYELIDVRNDDNHKPFKPVDTTKVQQQVNQVITETKELIDN